MFFSSVTSTLKLKTHSQLTQSPFTGTDCLFYFLVLIGRRLNIFIGDMYNIYMSSTTLQTCYLDALMWQTLKVLITPLLLVLEVCNVKPTYTK